MQELKLGAPEPALSQPKGPYSGTWEGPSYFHAPPRASRLR